MKNTEEDENLKAFIKVCRQNLGLPPLAEEAEAAVTPPVKPSADDQATPQTAMAKAYYNSLVATLAEVRRKVVADENLEAFKSKVRENLKIK